MERKVTKHQQRTDRAAENQQQAREDKRSWDQQRNSAADQGAKDGCHQEPGRRVGGHMFLSLS